MKIHQNVDGGPLFSAREYDIAPGTKVTPGQVVRLVEGLVVPAIAAQTGEILGISAEAHPGTPDAFDPRSNGTKICIYDNPGLLFSCKAPIVTASGGTATTVTATTLGAFANDDFNGGYLTLIEKAPDSTNTEPIGLTKRITDYVYTASGTISTFTVAKGGAASAGDKYALFPPVGFSKGNLNDNADSLVLGATAALAIKVVGRAGLSLIMMAKSHILK